MDNNITTKLEGNKLTIVVDLNTPGVPSASGKTMVLASTRGNVVIDAKGTTVGLNVYRKA